MNNNWEYDYSELYHAQNQKNDSLAQEPVNAQAQTTANEPENGEPKKKHRPNAKRIAAAAALVLFCGAAGFGGGYAGYRTARGTGTTVIRHAQTVQSDEGAAPAPGSALSVKDVAKIVGPSVVEVTTEQVTTHPIFGQFVQGGAGSGVILSQDGYIITNNHVVQGATQVKVRLTDGSEYEAKIVGTDSKTDVAVLKVQAEGLTSVVVGDSDLMEVGEPVIAVGNPLGRLGGSVTSGIVSALDRTITVGNEEMHLLQMDAAVSPGNSGGGLFNERGELIGIVNAKSGGQNTEGIGFAIPVNTAVRVAQELMDNGYVTGRPGMGVTVIQITDPQTAYSYGVSQAGVYVRDVNKGGAAEKAGLKPGDRFVSVDGVAVSETGDVTGALAKHQVGDTIDVQVARGKQMVSASIVLEELKPQQPAQQEG